MPQRATLRKAPSVAKHSPNGGFLLHCAEQTQAFIRAVYTGSAFESQWAETMRTFAEKSLATKRRGPKKKSGRGPPTSPTLRPRVLTPRDHFAHRGGGRAMIMHKSNSRCNPNFENFLIILRVQATTKIATPEKILSLPKFTLPQPEQRTRYCEVTQ